ncbi:MAG: reverse transcriptase family protein, partial [Chromatiales bacterium]
SQPRLFDFLQQDNEIRQTWERAADGFQVKLLLDPPEMGTLPAGLISFPLPELKTWKDLRLWLGLSVAELAWFADREGRQSGVGEAKLHHYRYRWLKKPSGAQRLLEIPKVRLKTIQRQILHELLDRVPVHAAAHGFRRHRSCLSYVTPHIGQAVVLRMDLQDFFHRVPVARIGALFRRLGYPPTVARLLQGLCTHASSPILAGQVFDTIPWESRQLLRHKHLPQGAPSSPAIANLCAWRLDCRLQGVAERFGLAYTRYADDLAFSGSRELLRLAPFLRALVGKIALEEGFLINQRKTRLQTRAQSQRLAGIVINERPNLPRREYDELKAILYNCVRYGPDSQNRKRHADFRSYLAGRIAYASWLNPAKGERLQDLWRRIHWPV